MLVAIIRRAIWDFVLYKDENPALYHPEKYEGRRRKREETYRRLAAKNAAIATDAAAWLFWDGEEESDNDGIYTFRYVCRILDLNPQTLRERALKLTRENLQVLNNHIKEE